MFFMRHLIRFLPLISLLLLLIASTSYGSPGNRKTGRSSVFSLFNLKERSKFWSEAVIRSDFDDLETTTVEQSSVLNFTKAGNVANYLQILEVEHMYLPVPVNFIFIGFEGSGNQAFKLHAEEIERWFTKIDHIFEHTRIPQTEEVLSSFYRNRIYKSHQHHLPLVSHLNYNFSVHAIQTSEKVNSIFEHAIGVFSRKDDTNHTRHDGLWQVDVDMMDVLFTSLVEYLDLENAYNIFVMNPKRDARRGKYGYRRGLSESEINFLKEDKSLQDKILRSGSVTDNALAIWSAMDKVKRPLYKKHPMAKFSWTITEETEMIEWYDSCLNALNNVERLSEKKDVADIIQAKVVQLLNGKNEDMKLQWTKDLKSGDLSGVHAECLTDTWIGKDRWAFIDLSAGPFSWGPAVGGEGVRMELTLPNVEKTIGAVAEITEEEAEDHLQEAIQEKFAAFGDKDHQAIDILLAEIDIYELFAFKHCWGRRVKLSLCEELDERMHDLKTELESFEKDDSVESHKQKAVDALKRMENWNLFSDIAYEHSHNYTVARDTFLAHMGATLWGSMRHIISPSIADGAFHHYEKISFQLFFITQEKVRNIKSLPVDINAITKGLSSLLLPSQKPMFSQHMLPLSEDPALAMAFSVSRRASAVPMLLVNGTFRRNVRSYLDSSILQHQLQRLSDHGSLKGSHALSRSTLEVPIFWFIHGEPLLVDKHYQAKALSDMVIVVQSDSSSWESHLQCNGQSLLWNLRRPIKAALAAVSEHIAGLLPLHLVYSQAHETAIEDWLWSVGCSPLSVTSQGWHTSQFLSDTIARSYMLTTLEESIQQVNSAIHRLLAERTSAQSFKAFQAHERHLVDKYNYVVNRWKRISSIAGELRFVDALRLLSSLEDASNGFVEYVNTTVASLHQIHCTKQRKVKVEFDLTTIPAFLVVFFVLWLVLKPRRPKAKIN
ncbi:hypothetical protein HanRHA438_Chr10g0468481 [Helianthus annuus]|uniref:DUF7906 domain-containing protein n=2 Tax=Helianthus annuus TaxID=4232 RepID=A0A251TNU7_HELAN|nr:uncharacterized protein LOC110886208 isoform X1 [Helianthus annuus]KAF5787671.1 hypothetical protein HanXRQr2_Chr10g0455451 [Helianthus annuus]KAJ0514876.1 hypothetical protein HanHA300_Chr10g0374481 [Helianthus annuus]KAJ0523196.1 hypothetical protein HanIR_Chr10g0491111 [Helianthus annuus]KAJ0531040.1 hypothetical protein HanHA89_Chr10g0396701 [Helianthus annuus]KAJ0697888.1 hypothetical protein HanLR1_Chr10g0374061 [Helianthus annuus]